MSSLNTRSCPTCGTVMPVSFPEELCPKCLLVAGGAGGEDTDYTMAAPAPAMALALGLALGRPGGAPGVETLRGLFPELDILEMLGAGGMGAVYKARQPRLNRLVALKIMVCPPGHEVDFTLRFEREAQVLARLNHPHIVVIHDFGDIAAERTGADALYYFLMEYVDGTDLGGLIRSKELKPADALAIVPQICDALQYAHDQGITHRDIKPANILVDKRGTVKIADFGLAKMIAGAGEALTSGLTQTGTALGTPHYMAPEQWEHPDQVDHRADIYALGVVFYEMLTGERPAGVFEPPSRKTSPPVDKKLDKVVLRALEKMPDRRYQQALQVKNEVVRISGAHPQRDGGDEETRGGPVRTLLLALGAAAALACGALALWPEKKAGVVESLKAAGAGIEGAPPLPSAQATTAPAYPPGQWVRVLAKLSDFPAETRTRLTADASGIWFTPGSQINAIELPQTVGKNWGIRAVFRRTGTSFSKLQLRKQGTQAGLRLYHFSLVESHGTTQIAHYDVHAFSDGTTTRSLNSKTLAPIPEGNEYTLEFIAIGPTLIGRINGQEANIVQDDSLEEGRLGWVLREPFRNLEVMNLDGLSEAEARKAASVE